MTCSTSSSSSSRTVCPPSTMGKLNGEGVIGEYTTVSLGVQGVKMLSTMSSPMVGGGIGICSGAGRNSWAMASGAGAAPASVVLHLCC